MSPYLVLLILEFFPARLATLTYGLDSNVTQLLANMLTKPSVFYYLPIVSIKLKQSCFNKIIIIIIIIIIINGRGWPFFGLYIHMYKDYVNICNSY